MISTIENNRLQVRVKTLGAELTSLETIDNGSEYLWQGDPRYWAGQAQVLFPIVGRVENGTCLIENEEYELGVHGFAKEREFRLVEQEPESLTYSLESDKDSLQNYPYRFALKVQYSLSGNALSVGYRVHNIDTRTLYFSTGAHPGFNCPWNEGTSMEDYSLVFEEPETAIRILHKEGLLNGGTELFLKGENRIKLSHELFGGGAIILKGLKSRNVTLKCSRSKRQVRVDFAGFPYLVIWSAKGNAPFVCIEPWYGVPSTRGKKRDLSKKEGIISLEAGRIFQCQYSIIVE